ALEYGFPSTHSANAVSVAVYVVLLLRSLPPPREGLLLVEFLVCLNAASVALGRLYCGMHGFLDVAVGSLVGAGLGAAEFYLGPALEARLTSPESTWLAPLTVALVAAALVRVHPEPVDDCPCFDDSVAFAGVVVGVEVGSWGLARGPFAQLAAIA